MSGQVEEMTGQAEDMPGHAEDMSGQAEEMTRWAGDRPRQAEWAWKGYGRIRKGMEGPGGCHWVGMEGHGRAMEGYGGVWKGPDMSGHMPGQA